MSNALAFRAGLLASGASTNKQAVIVTHKCSWRRRPWYRPPRRSSGRNQQSVGKTCCFRGGFGRVRSTGSRCSTSRRPGKHKQRKSQRQENITRGAPCEQVRVSESVCWLQFEVRSIRAWGDERGEEQEEPDLDVDRPFRGVRLARLEVEAYPRKVTPHQQIFRASRTFLRGMAPSPSPSLSHTPQKGKGQIKDIEAM